MSTYPPAVGTITPHGHRLMKSSDRRTWIEQIMAANENTPASAGVGAEGGVS